MEAEIITRTAEPEPALTVGQLTELLRAAADLERAQRPIILATAAEPATAPPHPGIAVTYPTTVVDPAPPAAARRLYTRAEVVYACGVSAACSTLVGALGAAFADSPMPLFVAAVIGMVASVSAAVTMTHDDDRAQLRAWRERRGGGQR